MTQLPPIHPGEFLKEELEERALRPSHLADAIAVPKNRISSILKGQRGITGDTALRLGHYLGTGPQVWMNLQSAYDLATARERSGDSIAALPTAEDAAPTSHTVK